jgi:hypothetical protein
MRTIHVVIGVDTQDTTMLPACVARQRMRSLPWIFHQRGKRGNGTNATGQTVVLTLQNARCSKKSRASECW